MPGARRGFSLIELVVGLAIMALLLALGLPSLNEYLANSKIRAQASSFNSTLQLARAEAIRLNGGVELVLTDDAPTAANKDSSTLSATGRNWMVRSFDAKLAGTPATACDDNAGKVGTPVYTLVEVKAAAEGSQRSDGSSPVLLSAQLSDGTALCRINFSGLGATDRALTASFNFSNPMGGNCVLADTPGPMRCLRVQVTSGGQVRLCDPAVATAGDARTCS